MYGTESSRWQAIQRRDHAAASSFVYAVVSTKIYCRPSCPSRLARRANVRFFNTAADAATAGYRPCLRCKPEQSNFNVDSQHTQKDAIQRACKYIEEMNGDIKFCQVAKHVGLSTRYLHGVFKSVTGTTPAKYAEQFKVEHRAYEPSETPLAISGTVNLPFNTLVEPALDDVEWSDLLNESYGNLTVWQEESELSLPYSSIFDGLSMITNVTTECASLSTASDLLPYDRIHTYPVNVETSDRSGSTNALYPF